MCVFRVDPLTNEGDHWLVLNSDWWEWARAVDRSSRESGLRMCRINQFVMLALYGSAAAAVTKRQMRVFGCIASLRGFPVLRQNKPLSVYFMNQ